MHSLIETNRAGSVREDVSVSEFTVLVGLNVTPHCGGGDVERILIFVVCVSVS